MRLPRRDALFKPLLAAVLSTPAVLFGGNAASAAELPAPAAAKATASAAVTSRVFLDVRIIKRFDVEVLEDAAIRGRLEIGLYGKDAPLATAKFLDFVQGTTGQFSKTGNGPKYSSAGFEKISPLTLVEGGKIAGLRQTTFAGALEWEYLSRLLPNLAPVLEVNDLSHDRRGLVTIERFSSGGPEFGITLANVPQLDDAREVIGVVQKGAELLDEIEALPFITGRSLEEPGSVADEVRVQPHSTHMALATALAHSAHCLACVLCACTQVFKAQKSLFSGLSKGLGDQRAEDRTGKLLRRVEITNCGLL